MERVEALALALEGLVLLLAFGERIEDGVWTGTGLWQQPSQEECCSEVRELKESPRKTHAWDPPKRTTHAHMMQTQGPGHL